eukprot:gene13914-biopygen4870
MAFPEESDMLGIWRAGCMVAEYLAAECVGHDVAVHVPVDAAVWLLGAVTLARETPFEVATEATLVLYVWPAPSSELMFVVEPEFKATILFNVTRLRQLRSRSCSSGELLFKSIFVSKFSHHAMLPMPPHRYRNKVGKMQGIVLERRRTADGRQTSQSQKIGLERRTIFEERRTKFRTCRKSSFKAEERNSKAEERNSKYRPRTKNDISRPKTGILKAEIKSA